MGQRRSVRLWAFALALGAVGLLAVYVAVAAGLDASHQGSSDFGSAYVGAKVWRAGLGTHLYDGAVQQAFHDAAVAPDRTPNVPFIDAPAAALLAAPFSLLDIRTGWRIFGLLQLAMLLAAALIAARSARWPDALPARARYAVALAGAPGAGTYVLVVQGQWSGLFALGIALGHWCWRRGHVALGAVIAFTPLLAVKPNLAIGLGAFLLGWGNRRALLGFACSLLAVAAVSLAVAGVSGSEGFVGSAIHSTHQWPWSSMNSLAGIVASWFGDSAATAVAGLSLALLASLGGAWFGRRLAGDALRLDAAMAGAVVITLLASPHLFHHDLALLAPVLVWGSATAARLDGGVAWPGQRSLAVLGTWFLFVAVAFEQLSAPMVGFPGRLVPWALLLMAGLAASATRAEVLQRHRPSRRRLLRIHARA